MLSAVLAGVENSFFHPAVLRRMLCLALPRNASYSVVTVGKDNFYNAVVQGGSAVFLPVL